MTWANASRSSIVGLRVTQTTIYFDTPHHQRRAAMRARITCADRGHASIADVAGPAEIMTI